MGRAVSRAGREKVVGSVRMEVPVAAVEAEAEGAIEVDNVVS